MSRRLSIFALTLLLSSSGLAACGGDGDGEPAANDDTTAGDAAGGAGGDATAGRDFGDFTPPDKPTPGQTAPEDKACQSYCSAVMGTCGGEHLQYPDEATCIEICTSWAGWPEGTADASTGNSLNCRLARLRQIEEGGNPATLCPEAGPTGGDGCGKWCEVYCDLAIRNCTGRFTLFSGTVDCLLACDELPDDGPWDAADGNNVQCRINQLVLAGSDPDGGTVAAHCPAGSVAGSFPCGRGSGDTCAAAIPITDYPATITGDTSEATPSFSYNSGSCPGEQEPGGRASSDQVYRMVAGREGLYQITVDPDFTGLVYLARDCENIDRTCRAANTSFGDIDITLRLDAGEEIFLFIDGDSNTRDESGPYTINITDPCVPSCEGRVCGDDGCGGSCGTCDAEGTLCNLEGQCQDAASLVGNTCANPLQVDTAPFSLNGNTREATNDLGFSEDACEPQNLSRGNGSNDHILRFTPPSTGVYTIALDADFDSVLYVAGDCANVDGSCLAGVDRGAVETAILPLEGGVPVWVVVDGWSDTTNRAGTYGLTISEPCVQSCAGRQCGSDGCNSTCGTCDPGDLCSGEGQCLAAETFPGNTCTNPFPISAIPFSAQGDTGEATNVFSFGDGACPGRTSGLGRGSADHVYSFTPTVTGTYEVVIESEFDVISYITTNCADIDGTCLTGGDAGFSTERRKARMEAGTQYFIFVDGFSNFTNSSGTYSIAIGEPCLGDCDGRFCGDDGCGSTCGTCELPTLCDPEPGQCLPPAATPGNTCATPLMVGALPFEGTGDTSDAQAIYQITRSGSCEGTSTKGAASKDHVWQFTPPSAGRYKIELTSTFDAALYVAIDCASVDGSCLGGSDSIGTERLTLDLDSATTYFIFVDGWSNSSDVNGSYTLKVEAAPAP